MDKDFTEKVYALVQQIPAGHVMSYGQVAAAIGSPRHARHVGQALKCLNREDIPWHRVLQSSGRIAEAGQPGRPMIQQHLLEAEGVLFVRDRVPMREYQYIIENRRR